jgi:NTE family protein
MRIAALSLSLLLTACAGLPDTKPINLPLATTPAPKAEIDIAGDGDVIALALSGGGARAASFSLGVLQQLRDTKDSSGGRLIDRVAMVTAVSGGAITAAWFGQHGPDGLDGLRPAVLDKDWQSQLHTTWMSPQNWDRLMQGGLNGPDKLSNWLDKEVFNGARMSDLKARPRIIINATDLYSGAPFAFEAPWFDAICSDLDAVRVSDAVAASMAVPVAFRPIVVRTYGRECPHQLAPWVVAAEANRTAPMLLRETARSFRFFRDSARMDYIHLADGGVADNFGVSSIVTMRAASGTPHGPFTARDAVKLKRFTFFIVNAERGAEGDWARKESGPDGAQLVEALLGVSVNAPKRAAADAFAGEMERWERDIIEWRCGLTPERAASLGAPANWNCRDVDFRLDIIAFGDLTDKRFEELGKAATAVSLPPRTIDILIEGGRQAIRQNPEVLKLAQ